MSLQERFQMLANAAAMFAGEPIPSEAAMVALLEGGGWHTWHAANSWVHPRYESPVQSYTDCGMTLTCAYRAEMMFRADKDANQHRAKDRAAQSLHLVRRNDASAQGGVPRIRSAAELRAIRNHYARKTAA